NSAASLPRSVSRNPTVLIRAFRGFPEEEGNSAHRRHNPPYQSRQFRVHPRLGEWVLAAQTSQSHRTNQGNSEELLGFLTLLMGEVSQSHRTPKGNSRVLAMDGLVKTDESQSHRTAQGNFKVVHVSELVWF